MSIKEAAQENFDTVVAGAGKPVVAYFWAPWCQSCKLMAPQIEALSKENAERFEVVKVNIAENPELTEKYNIMSTPTLYVFKPGAQPKNFHMGYAVKNYLMEVLEKYL